MSPFLVSKAPKDRKDLLFHRYEGKLVLNPSSKGQVYSFCSAEEHGRSYQKGLSGVCYASFLSVHLFCLLQSDSVLSKTKVY